MASLPSLFLPHGAPDLLLSTHVSKDFLGTLGSRVERPAAILIVSAHWEAAQPTLTTAEAPETVHDFFGFPDALYRIRYPARTASDLVDWVDHLLADQGVAAASDPERGFDHGAWVPLSLAYPDADIPVVQLSLVQGGTARQHFEIGRALAPLRGRDVLIVGSGSVTHNLRELGAEGTPPPVWATAFDDWVSSAVEAGDWENLMQFPEAPETSRRAHPTPEHFLPFYVAAGAGAGEAGRKLHGSYSHGSISMSAYAFGGSQAAT
ncbi:DODA-type extradiol aromatic ring-opening family dioxygenase [Nisaea denitrificans]|uniref:DODA-type extradiol aromatic ring-opening family dioxygenase n=1 Tax=Nisaea denitrificans TaxID=390877 RepID=UPI000411C093|nr:class III extradiol ring-cleavage dioxygenase [Nisaea denitrificans]